MTDKPITDALNKPIVIPEIEGETIEFAMEATQQDQGATLTMNKDIGKPGGWTSGAAASWWKSAGASVKWWIGWKGKS